MDARFVNAPDTIMRKIVATLVIAIMLGAVAGCADGPSTGPAAPPAPEASAPQGALLGLVALTPVLQRSTSLAADVTVKARIGAEGGSFAIPAAGLRVVVPRGAVSEPTEFSATAIAGRAVAYEFEPHGARFARPLQITQELRGTEWIGLPLLNFRAAYFKDRDQLDPEKSLLQVDELLPLSLDLLRLQLRFNVEHFSGYAVSTGRAASVSVDE
jgi:hypothetical protein